MEQSMDRSALFEHINLLKACSLVHLHFFISFFFFFFFCCYYLLVLIAFFSSPFSAENVIELTGNSINGPMTTNTVFAILFSIGEIVIKFLGFFHAFKLMKYLPWVDKKGEIYTTDLTDYSYIRSSQARQVFFFRFLLQFTQ
jgi:hypothetical protein